MTPHSADTHLKEETLESTCVFKGNYLTIQRDKIQMPDGNVGEREYIQHPGAVMIIPQFEDGHFLMERQYRYPFHAIMLEFPAGKMEKSEAPLLTAQRELEEETGYQATEWQQLTSFHPIVSYTNETIHMFHAKGLIPTQTRLDEGEFIEIIKLSPEEAMHSLKSGLIRDGKTILALLWLAQLGQYSCPPL